MDYYNFSGFDLHITYPSFTCMSTVPVTPPPTSVTTIHSKPGFLLAIIPACQIVHQQPQQNRGTGKQERAGISKGIITSFFLSTVTNHYKGHHRFTALIHRARRFSSFVIATTHQRRRIEVRPYLFFFLFYCTNYYQAHQMKSKRARMLISGISLAPRSRMVHLFSFFSTLAN